jgi:hypothetical protein
MTQRNVDLRGRLHDHRVIFRRERDDGCDIQRRKVPIWVVLARSASSAVAIHLAWIASSRASRDSSQ